VAAFCGCLYAGAIAVPVPLPVGGAASLRLRSIAWAARPAAILSVHEAPGVRNELERAAANLSGIPVIFADDVADVAHGPDTSDPCDIALIQYTSGSTSRPKGVAISQTSLSANLQMLRHAWSVDGESRFVSWLPLYHDMGLISVVLEALWAGAMTVLISPLSFLHDPANWLDAIGRYRATISGGPNFAFDLCVRRCGGRPARALDLSSWRVAFCASEPVRASTMEAFATAFAAQGLRSDALYPAYGLAEATVFVSGGLPGSGVKTLDIAASAIEGDRAVSVRRLVGCGRPWDDSTVVIVDPESREAMADGQVGEIWVSGSQVADGYWQDPAATQETFGAKLAGSIVPDFLRTGDLGLLKDGELYFAGRLKDLLVVRGVGIDPSDIESAIARSHSVMGHVGAAFTVDADDEEQVVAVHELARGAAPGAMLDEAIGAAFKTIADEHGLRLYDLVLVQPGKVPRTTSGKVQRRRCREQYLAGAMGQFSVGVDYPWLGKHRRSRTTQPERR
jgi:acyl-CoA synthetase (AMP-forming)/AMP-acid ligase II